MIGLSVLLFSSLFLMLRTGKEFTGDVKITGSFIDDIRIIQKKNGSLIWTLTANKANFIEGEDIAELSDVNMTLEKNGVVLHATKGFYTVSNRMFSTKNIVNAEGKDYRITADSVDYDISSGRMKTEGRITVEGKGFTVEGKGMDADTAQKVRIFNDVKATFNK